MKVNQKTTLPKNRLGGIGNGINGTTKRKYNRHFNAFAVIYLANFLASFRGNFTVWPQPHRNFNDFFQKDGHTILAEGMLQVELPAPPVIISGLIGGLIFAHYQVVHSAFFNASPDVRLAIISHIRHKDCETIGKLAYTHLWREWPGLQEYLPTK